MKAVKLWGGLGNQLFQYAFARYLSELVKEEVVFYQMENEPIKPSLDLFQSGIQIKMLPIQTILNHFLLGGKGLKYRIERKALMSFPFLNRDVFVEPSPHYNTEISLHATLYDGYWQSYKYLEPFEDSIKASVSWKDIPEKDIETLRQIEGCNSVSLHIRRGDYLNAKNARIYATCDANYYSAAIRQILGSVEDPVFYIFSNDIRRISVEMEVLKKYPVFYMNHEDEVNGHVIDFFLMSRCKHNIIANSTFSWWGAWLNRNLGKVIIAPENWYKGRLNLTTRDLIPENWIRL